MQWKPRFNVVDWAGKSEKPVVTKTKKPMGKPAANARTADIIDDEIPFKDDIPFD